MQLYAAAAGGLQRGQRGLGLRRCPTFVFQRQGEQLGERASERKRAHYAASADGFINWAWPHLEVELTVHNQLRRAPPV